MNMPQIQIPAAVTDALARAQSRFRALTRREQWAVAICAVVVGALILYAGIYQPITRAHDARAESLAQARRLAERLQMAAAQKQNAPHQTPIQRGGSLLSVVDQTIRQSALGKAPDRVQPEGDTEVRVWLQGVPFDAMVRWLGELQSRYGVSVQTLDVERSGDAAGAVDARISLTRTG